jgi:hypothetical protein
MNICMWYGTTKLLTVDVWKTFQHMFEESGFEVYERREQVIVPVERTEEQRSNNEDLLLMN